VDYSGEVSSICGCNKKMMMPGLLLQMGGGVKMDLKKSVYVTCPGMDW
jgi:hypothetical protein